MDVLGSVVIVEETGTELRRSIARDFARCRYEVWITDTPEAARQKVEQTRPFLFIADSRLGNDPISAWIPRIKTVSANTFIAVVTSRASVTGAVRAIRAGADAYLALPTTASLIVSAISGDTPDDSNGPMSLGRAVWEYLNHVLETTGSISGAARRLGIHRRSLQRMLAKHPPPR